MEDVEPPPKWHKYLKLYEDAKSRYQPCSNINLNSESNNPHTDGNFNNLSPSLATPDDKVSCLYEDIIEKDLAVFNGRIR